MQIKHPTQTDEELGSNFIQCSKNREGINLKLRKARVKEQKITPVNKTSWAQCEEENNYFRYIYKLV